MLCFIRFLLLLSLLKHEDHITLARHTLSRRVSWPFVISASNTSAASPLVQTHSSSFISASRSVVNNHTYGIASATTALPTPIQLKPSHAGDYKSNNTNQGIKSETCATTDDHCPSKKNIGTARNTNATDINNQCILWDPSCPGNRISAIDKLFDPTSQNDLLSNRCFIEAGSTNIGNISNCVIHNSSDSTSNFQRMKIWLRSQQCVTAHAEWAVNTTDLLDPDSQMAIQMDPYSYHVTLVPIPSCCGGCEVFVKNVDIYYWPEPDVNTSCLSIIGNSIRPLDYGATKTVDYNNETSTYWGCDASMVTTYVSIRSATETYPTVTTTATVSTVGSLLIKVSLSDPWSPSPCTPSDVMSQGSDISLGVLDKHATMHARDHSLIIPSSVTHNGSLSVNTIVSGDFTFTSPSVYAMFHGITATDQCGGVILSSTMVAFAPGELSTIAGPLGDEYNPFSTKSYNFKDLPCPPQSVMEENWYKPQPGEPYRPLIAMPSKLIKKVPWFSSCLYDYFTAYDPPSALTTETALAQPIAQSEPKAHPWAPVPSPTLTSGARQTLGTEKSIPIPANVPSLDQPKATVPATSVFPKQKGSLPNDPAAHEGQPSQPLSNSAGSNGDSKGGNDPQQNGDPRQSIDPKHGGDSSSVGDQKEPSDPNQSNSPKQGNDNSQDPEPEADPKPYDSSNQAGDSQGLNQNAGAVPPSDSKPNNDANPFDDLTEGQTRTINNQAVQPFSHGISIAGTTLTPGAPAITVSGTLIRFDASALVIGASTVPLPSASPNFITTTIAGHVITAAPDAIAVADTTLTRGAPPITVSGTPIQLGSSALIVGTSTVPLIAPAPVPITTTIAGQAITAAPNAVAIAGNILNPGAPATTIDGTALSLDTAGRFIVGSRTVPFASTVPKTVTTNIAGQAITAAPNGIVIAGATLSPGAPGTTLDGTLISLGTASQLMIGSKTISLQSTASNSITTTIGGQVITAASNRIAIASTELTPGASGVTVGGTLISLNLAGQLVVGSKTVTLSSGSTNLGGLIMGGIWAGAPYQGSERIITTIDGQVITADPTALAMAGATLTPGAPGFTINGTLVSLNTAARLVVGSQTIQLGGEDTGSIEQNAGLGGLILGAFRSGGAFGPFTGNLPSPTRAYLSTGAVNGTNNGMQVFEGSATNLHRRLMWIKNIVSVVAISVLAYMC